MKNLILRLLMIGLLLVSSVTNRAFAEPSEQKVLFWNTDNADSSLADNDEAFYNFQLLKENYIELGYTVSETEGEFLTSEDIDSITILVLYFPQRNITKDEIEILKNYLDLGGGLMMSGENNSLVPEVNERLSLLASELESSITFTDDDVVDGFNLSIEDGINSNDPVNEDVVKEDETDLKIMLGNIVNYSQARIDGDIPQTTDSGLKLGWMNLLGLAFILASKIKIAKN
jgi:hypothetical protein